MNAYAIRQAARPVSSGPMPLTAPGASGSSSHVSEAVPQNAPGLCPVCGARSLLPEGSSSALVAVCDVLVVKSLEVIGKRIVREDRNRFRTFNGRPWHLAHTVWGASESLVTRALARAWDVVPALLDTHGCCGVTSRQVTEMLDSYVHDLVMTGTAHAVTEMAYRFESRLGLPVYLHERHSHAEEPQNG